MTQNSKIMTDGKDAKNVTTITQTEFDTLALIKRIIKNAYNVREKTLSVKIKLYNLYMTMGDTTYYINYIQITRVTILLMN